jgi:UDP-GlcNAc:undecaprenyl-phosphate/decaprenyl-phosphate GlcNAc-1-phosphate transferase
MTMGGGVIAFDLGSLFGLGDVELDALAVPFTSFAVVGVINAFNMADGEDGMAGGLALTAFALLAALAFLAGHQADASLLTLFAFAVLGFLLLNMRRPGRAKAEVFMGNAGSMFLGFTAAWFMVRLSQGQTQAIAPVTALWLLAVPLCDAVAVILRRLISGRSPFEPDRGHLHHHLRDKGLSPAQTVAKVLMCSLALGLVGAFAQAYGLPDWLLFNGFLACFLCYFIWALRLSSFSRQRAAVEAPAQALRS